jgi:DNA-binding NarL/FixJ family response regulator
MVNFHINRVHTKNGLLKMTGILIVLDYMLVRQALKRQIEINGNLKVIGEAVDCPTACQMAHDLTPDVIIVDLEKHILDGVETALEMNRRQPQTPLILLSSKPDPVTEAGLQQLGNLTLVLRQANTSALIQAIRQVAPERSPHPG